MRSFPAHLQKEFGVFKKLNSSGKIQIFLDRLPVNFEKRGSTCASPLTVLRTNQAHCIEGALLAAAALWYHGTKPLLLDLKTTKKDSDHVVALFKKRGYWGAISKTNHAVLRYRDPVYRSVREIVMSYFHEYFLDNGQKTLRSFSAPFSMLAFDDEWLTSPDNLWPVAEALDNAKHYPILADSAAKLRLAHRLEIKAGELVEWRETI